MNVDYDTYILSDEWKARADDAKQRAGWRCQLCNQHACEVQPFIVRLEAHHRTYQRLGNELDSDITVLCSRCHGWHHAHEYERAPAPPPPPVFWMVAYLEAKATARRECLAAGIAAVKWVKENG